MCVCVCARVCVCVCAHARARACVCVCAKLQFYGLRLAPSTVHLCVMEQLIVDDICSSSHSLSFFSSMSTVLTISSAFLSCLSGPVASRPI